MLGSVNVLAIGLIAVVGYFLGNIQTALIISRAAFQDDVRFYGSGNSGTTNMIRVYGKLYGVLTFLGDSGKCAIAFLVGRLLARWLGLGPGCEEYAIALGGYICTDAAILGHCYPVLFQFRGGKGAASAFALMWCFCWQAAAVSTIAVVLIFLLWKRMSLVSMLTAILYGIIVLILHLCHLTDPYLVYFTLPISALIVFRHKDNIKRLIHGQEAKLDTEHPMKPKG